MKIAILNPTFSAFSGPDRVVELQAEDFSKKGDSVTILALKAGMKAPKNVKIIEIGMPKNHTFERIYRLLFFLDFKKINKYVKMLKGYDLVISHQYPMNVIALRAKNKYGLKYVYHNQGVAYPELFRSVIERVYMRIFRWLTNFTAKRADEAVSISKFLQRELKNETGKDSRIVYDTINRERFHSGISGERIRKKYGFGNKPICLYVGRISPHKGIHLLINAFNIVLKKIPNARLLIVGKETFGNYAKELKALANKVNPSSIIFTGFVPDKELPYYYAACNIYTTASMWEGFDMPIVEAAACGKPSIVFNIGAHKEVLKKGKLVKAGDVKEFSKAIMGYFKNENKK